MLKVLTIGNETEKSCFHEVLREFGYESSLYETDAGHLSQMLTKVKKEDFLLIQGDVSKVREKDLVHLLKQLHKEGIHVILSFPCESWQKLIGTRPFLIVPEQQDLVNTWHEIRNENDAMRILVRMHDRSHGNVILPLKEEKKVVFVCADGREFVSQLPYGAVRNDAYAAASMTAGFLAAYCSFHDYVKTFHYAVSAYSLSAWQGKPAGRIETEDTYQMMKEKKIWMK